MVRVGKKREKERKTGREKKSSGVREREGKEKNRRTERKRTGG